MIDLDPNEDLMCQTNGHPNVLCSSHLKIHYRWEALWLRMAWDYRATENTSINEATCQMSTLIKIHLPCGSYKMCLDSVYRLRHNRSHRQCSFLVTMCSNCPTVSPHSNRNLYHRRQLSNHDQSISFLFRWYSKQLCRLHSQLELMNLYSSINFYDFF